MDWKKLQFPQDSHSGRRERLKPGPAREETYLLELLNHCAKNTPVLHLHCNLGSGP
ncbi:mCG1051094 [Mus musculus]|nr:mCG1051094 [Mus musculus]